jgi:hypothetical protein
MKRTSVLILFAMIVAFMAGCKPAVIETISSTSPDGSRKVVVTGEQKAPMDPITVTVTLEYKDQKHPFLFNHQAQSLTSQNCSIEWLSQEAGKIVLNFDDQGSQVIEFIVNDQMVNAIKQFSLEDVVPH